MTLQLTNSAMPLIDRLPTERDLTSPVEPLRLIALGSPEDIRMTILRLHHLGYAEPNDWSQLLPTGRPNEMMAILTKRIAR